jgi:hypothetical protein
MQCRKVIAESPVLSTLIALLIFAASLQTAVAQTSRDENPFVSLDGTPTETSTLPSVPEAVEYDRLIRANRSTAPLDDGLFGESIDYFTGQTDFVAIDLDLPNGNGIPVRIGRRYHVQNHAGGVVLGAFGDWDFELPHVEGVVATGVGWTVPASTHDERCTYFGAPPPAVVTTASGTSTITTTVPAREYSLGFAVVIPGAGRHELLLRDADTPAPDSLSIPHPVTTKELWAVSCKDRNTVPQQGGPDEGFVVTTPDGLTYTFTQGYVRPYTPLIRPADTTTAGVNAVVDRQEVWLLPVKIEDRFGNYVQYTYSLASPLKLTKIEANDGRKITITYDTLGTHIQSLSDGRRTWTYTYNSLTKYLTGVELPDGADWQIDFHNLNAANWTYNSQTCNTLAQPASGSTTTAIAEMDHHLALMESFHSLSGGAVAMVHPPAVSRTPPGSPLLHWNHRFMTS